ncbi:DUF1707 domain-containing protein [Streptomyces sp. NPDC101227]|uniref:DUF1707 SHOCT-like domain-containing protein n=1 Tax=Streptomyces sp. NPDC101227 TaxID=3366136 RepID=UPI003830D85B
MTEPRRPYPHKELTPPPTASSPAPVLASDAEREDMVERLREAAAEGRLTLEELAERCEAAYLARFREELVSVGEGLPTEAAASRAGGPSGRRAFRAVFGDLTHHHPGLEDRLEATAILGDVTLDLCASPAPASGELSLVANAILGDVHLLLPEGVRVEVKCGNLFGAVRDLTRAHSAPDAAAPLIRVTGFALFGDIVLAHPSSDRRAPWQKWLDERRGHAGAGARTDKP